MSISVITRELEAPEVNKNEILRYSGERNPDDREKEILDSCIRELLPACKYRLCYGVMPLEIKGSTCDFGDFTLESSALSRNMKGCKRALLFAATVGLGVDRLIIKYSSLSPVRAVFMQAAGAERIEELCNNFCKSFAEENNIRLTSRFSPGYGDLPLEAQRDIFSVLSCHEKIGLCLNNSLMMSPSKSVTAVAGIKE